MKNSFPVNRVKPVSTMPLVSVIVGNYNYGCFLAEAIESVLNQTYSAFELIVVDDGSTDNSQEIMASYSKELIAIFQNNAGQGAAFNTAIKKSRGEIICFLDPDDYFYPDKLAKVVAGFQTHPEWVQISHGRTSVDKKGNIIGRDPTFFSQGDVRSLLLRWGKYAWAVTSGLSYRRWVIEQVFPIPSRGKAGASDTYLTATVPFYGEVGCIGEPLMYYRRHGNNKHANSTDLSYFIWQKEVTANYINKTAQKVGIKEKFAIDNDADYRSFKALQCGGGSWQEGIKITWLTIQESWAISHHLKDFLERLLRRGVCTFLPTEGKTWLRLGPKRYIRFKLTGKVPEYLTLNIKH